MTIQSSARVSVATAPVPTLAAPDAGTMPLWKTLAPICMVVFLEFLAMGLPLPVMPVHIHDTMGFEAFIVGLAIGAQSLATLLTRHGAGAWSDQHGPRNATGLGLAISALAGLLYMVSSAVTAPMAALTLLLIGRVVLGLGESLVITGALAWGVALAGRQRSGVVMSWVGIAMYSALAAGAPLGTMVFAGYGFVGVSFAAALAPILGFSLLAFARAVEPARGARLPFYRVFGMIWLPGLGLTLSALGFGAIAAFSSLRFAEAGWPFATLAMTAFGAAYVLARLLLGGLPDKFGGARIAMASAAVAGVGQLVMWLATSGAMAVAAAAVTGFGFSLAFPSFGVEAIRPVPPQNRGVAIGAYAACFDVAMGIGVPVLGVVVGAYGYRAAFFVGAISALGSLFVAAALVYRRQA